MALPKTVLKKYTVVRTVPLEPDESFDLTLLRKEHLRTEVWGLVAQEVTPGVKYVMDIWEETREREHEYGVRFIRVPMQ